ncbi:MAG: DUF1232 domain-containing protein, partial [Chloroflexi bacterium]|nr:DUF1232 domain-containing protein [Chloroflexota bacterium]
PISTSPGALAQFVQTLRLVWRLLTDARVPALPKLIPLAAAIYIISPIDLLPDFILGLGQLDDLGIFFLSIALFIEFCPKDIVAEHRHAIQSRARAPSNANDAIDGTYRVVSDEESNRKE